MTTSAKNNRIHEIDALRGLALYGILLVNIFVFHAPYGYYGEFYGEYSGLQGIIINLVVDFAAGKFLFLFALLFGYGAWLQKKSAQRHFNTYFLKRMLWLLVIGVLHILLFWFGDILTSYALLGLTLIPLSKIPSNLMLLLAVVLLFFRPLYYVGVIIIGWPMLAVDLSYSLEEFITTFSQGSFIEIFDYRMDEFLAFQPENFVWYIPKTLGLFLLGLFLGQKSITTVIQQNTIRFLLLSVTFLVVNVIWHYNKLDLFALVDLNTTPFLRPFLIMLNVIFETTLGLSYFFIGLIVFQSKSRLAIPFALTGRMALTNYLLQSLVCVTIFYGFGLGFYAQLLPSSLIILATFIFLFNILISKLYLKYFRMGPMEFVWRKLSRL